MRYFIFGLFLLCCAGVAAQGSSYYVRGGNGKVRVKAEGDDKWRECSVSDLQSVGLTDSVMADEGSDLVIVRQTGSAKGVVRSDVQGGHLLVDILKAEEEESGRMVARSNVGVEEGDDEGATHGTRGRLSTRGTLTSMEQIDTLVSTVRMMVRSGRMTEGKVKGVVVRDDVYGDYMRITNGSDSVQYINVLVREKDGSMHSLYGDVTEDAMAVDGESFPFIAVAAGGTLNLDMWRFFELGALELVLVSSEDKYNIVLFNDRLTDEEDVTASETMAAKMVVVNIK